MCDGPAYCACGEIRLLAAAGPVDAATLVGAITRSHQYKHRRPVTLEHLTAALTSPGATHEEQGRWHAPTGTSISKAPRGDGAAAGAGRDMSRQDMIHVLITAGYTPSAAGLMSRAHPMFTRIAHIRYRVHGNHHLKKMIIGPIERQYRRCRFDPSWRPAILVECSGVHFRSDVGSVLWRS